MNRFDVAIISIDDVFLFGYGAHTPKMFSYMSIVRVVIVATPSTNISTGRCSFSGN